MSIIKVSDYIAQKIYKLGIRDLPVFQGGAIFHIIDSIGINKKLRYFCPYHEQSLAMSVDGYSRIKGLGVGCVTSGPGATNLITGVCSSFHDSIPNIYFTGQVGQFHIKKNGKRRQKGFQETDVVRLFSSISKFSYQIKNPNEIDYIIDKAIHIAKTGRPGPVIIDVPYNVQISKIDTKSLKKFHPKKDKIDTNMRKKITSLFKSVSNMDKVVVIAGGGIRVSNQVNEFKKFIKNFNLPFVSSWPSQDITNFNNNLYFGSIGRHGNQCANEIIASSNIVITLGFRFGPKAINENFGLNPRIKIISVDIDDQELIDPNVKIGHKLKINLIDFFRIINAKKFNKYSNRDWLNFCKQIKEKKFINNLIIKGKKISKINPYLFFHKLSDLVNKDAIIFNDTGANLCWCMMSFRVKFKQRLISAFGHSPMGYSISAAIGAKYAEKNKQIISVIGDGSFILNVQDMQFLKHHDINLKIIVIDNQSLGNTRLGTKAVFSGRTFANERKYGYFPPDIRKITQSFDIKYIHLHRNNDIDKKINIFLNCKKNTVLHVVVSKEMDVVDHTQKELQSTYSFSKY